MAADELQAENERLRGEINGLHQQYVDAVDRRVEAMSERDTWRERWRQLMRDHEAVVTERDELEAERDAAREQVRQRDEVLHWLIGMDEPESEARRTVTLTEIIRRARAALEGDGR